jgi:hypothetical protein
VRGEKIGEGPPRPLTGLDLRDLGLQIRAPPEKALSLLLEGAVASVLVTATSAKFDVTVGRRVDHHCVKRRSGRERFPSP